MLIEDIFVLQGHLRVAFFAFNPSAAGTAFLCVIVSAAANRGFKNRALREECGALSWGSWPELDEFHALFAADVF